MADTDNIDENAAAPGEVTVPGAIPMTFAVVSVSRSRKIRSASTSRWRAGSRRSAAISAGSTPPLVSAGAAASCSARGTSRCRRRHHETPRFSAVRTTHARGAACVRTLPHDVQARVKASATCSSASSRSPTTAVTALRQESLLAR